MTEILPSYTGVIPNRSQDEDVFAPAADAFVDWMATTLPANFSTAFSHFLSLIGGEIYDDTATYNATGYTVPSFVYGSDGITYRCVGDNVTGDNPVGSETGDWVALMVGVEELADGNSRHIVGGDITKTSDHVLTISACACWDSTYSDYLETTSSDTVTIASDANTLYNIFIVRLVADDSIEFRAYEIESDIDADADVNTYRWLMEWSNDGSGVLRPGYSVGDYKLWSRASKSVISAGVTTSFAIVDHTTQINTDRAELIHYGANSASVETFVTASLDGTYVAWTVSRTIATNDMSYIAWGQDMPGHFVPFSADVKFKADSGTVNLLVHQVKYRR